MKNGELYSLVPPKPDPEVVKRQQHETAWWATYRAALTGIYARYTSVTPRPDVCHGLATAAANNAHGPRWY